MDVARFEAILNDNQKRIYHYLLKMVHHPEDAEDLLQAVFLSFYERMDDIDERAYIVYLFRMAHNKAINHMKNNKRYLQQEPEKFDLLKAPVEKRTEDRDQKIRDAIKSLPPKLAAVITMQIYDDLSYKEIADRMKLSVSAVESLLVRAKKQLRTKIMQEKKEEGVLIS